MFQRVYKLRTQNQPLACEPYGSFFYLAAIVLKGLTPKPSIYSFWNIMEKMTVVFHRITANIQ